ncbi:GNAT family N-acetyltransferase [Flexibacterium corallicola]|uniref:GNAT family N-acetyltransferase n=1 Tax=Flexibacterium corallicola TaxID=3037259 RepID=UPI00286ED9CA|nr:GNAT family N-acetyltransferase [Pseudovibrio sp. M1P-2-3]
MTSSKNEAQGLERVTGELVYLADCSASQLFDYNCRNRDHLRPWEPLRNENGPSLEDCEAAIENARKVLENKSGTNFAFLKDGKIIGQANFSGITGFPFRACYMGFSIDAGFQGQGYAREMLKLAIDRMFREHPLNRIMANYMPRNMKSARLLNVLGFRIEGFAYKYLEINGQWEDHFLSSLLSSDWENKS